MRTSLETLQLLQLLAADARKRGAQDGSMVSVGISHFEGLLADVVDLHHIAVVASVADGLQRADLRALARTAAEAMPS